MPGCTVLSYSSQIPFYVNCPCLRIGLSYESSLICSTSFPLPAMNDFHAVDLFSITKPA